jgi:hypothetical protein
VQIRSGSKETLMHNTDRTQLEFEHDAYEAERGGPACRCSELAAELL